MKTTVEISDPLLSRVKELAAREGSTMRALIEEGLRHVVRERDERGDFELRHPTFGGRGLRPEVGEGSWERIREMIYRGRGG